MRLVAAAILLATAGCQPSLDAQLESVDRFAKGNRVGSSADVFLLRDGLAGTERVALIYAMSDDMAFCLEIAEIMAAKYPATRYSCGYAN